MWDWQLIQKRSQQGSAAVSVFLNSLVMHLVVAHSPTSMGSYKMLMISTALFEMAFSVVEVVVQPIIHSFGLTFVIIVNVQDSYWSYDFLKVVNSIYCGFFGSLLALFSIQFVYRYWILSANKHAKSFDGFKILLWLLIPLISGWIWGLGAYFPCAPRESSDRYLEKSIMDEFNLDITNGSSLYIAPYFWEEQDDGNVTIYWPSFAIIFVDSQIITQLFYSLVSQVMIPTILMHIPVSIMFLSTFLNFNIGPLSGVVTVTVALFPAIDPLPAIFIVKSYRRALQSYLCRAMRVLNRKQEVSVLPSAITPRTF